MKRKLTRLLIISCLFMLLVGSLDSVAQEKRVEPGELKAPTDGTFKVLASKFAFGKVVKGAPYSATAITETIQTLSDGNQIIHKNQSKLYRDSEGRTRIEQTLGTIGKWTAAGEARQITFINDPVAGFSYSLDSHTRTAHKGGTGINVKDLLNEAGQEKASAQKIESLKANRGKFRDKPTTSNAPPPQLPGEETKPEKLPPLGKVKEAGGVDLRWKTESLGMQVIEGVEVELARATRTIPAGEIGNALPIEVVDETWYSHELQVVVMSKRRDPRSGETTYRLININRSEPNRGLFEVPADYTLKDGSGGKSKPVKKPEEQ